MVRVIILAFAIMLTGCVSGSADEPEMAGTLVVVQNVRDSQLTFLLDGGASILAYHDLVLTITAKDGSSLEKRWNVVEADSSGMLFIVLGETAYVDVDVRGTLVTAGGRTGEVEWRVDLFKPGWLSFSAYCSDGATEVLVRPMERKAGEFGTDYAADGAGSLAPLFPRLEAIKTFEARADTSVGPLVVTDATRDNMSEALRVRIDAPRVDAIQFAFEIQLDDGRSLTEEDFYVPPFDGMRQCP